MSQFLIAISKTEPVTCVQNITFVKASQAQRVFSDVVESLGIEPSHAWAVLDETGDTTDSIFASAGADLARGEAFSKTELGKLIGGLLYADCRLVAWYANDYKDLEKFISIVELVEYMNRELPVGSGDVYFEYR
jgi:hypothetical protein